MEQSSYSELTIFQLQLYKQQTRCNNKCFLIIPISSACFGLKFRPSAEALDCVYSFWYNATTMLMTGNLDVVEHLIQFNSRKKGVPPLLGYRTETSWVHCTTRCKHTFMHLRMREIIARNMFSCLELLTLILRGSRTGTVWFYTSTSNKRAARPKLYTKSLTRDLKLMYSRFTLVRISINL